MSVKEKKRGRPDPCTGQSDRRGYCSMRQKADAERGQGTEYQTSVW